MRSSELKQIEIEMPVFHLEEESYKLNYLDSLSPEDKDTVEKTYGKSIVELDKEIDHYRKIFYSNCVQYVLAAGTNGLYIIFQLNTTEEGAPTFIRVFVPNANIPSVFGKIVGYPTAILGSTTYIVNFNPKNEAALDTLYYIHRAPWRTRLYNTLVDAYKNPLSAAEYLFHHGSLLLFNISAIMTEVLEVPGINDFLPILRGITAASILYHGVLYMTKYANRTYFQELKDYWKNNNYSWIVPYLIKRRQWSTLLQIFIKSVLSTACIRGYPTHFYIATAANEFFGFFPPAIFMAVLAGFVNFMFLHPSTVREYLADAYVIEDQLKKINDPNQIAAALHVKPEFVINNPLKTLRLQNEAHHAEVVEKYGYTYLKKDLSVIFLGAYRGFVGGFFGYNCIAPVLLLLIDAPLTISIISTSGCALAFLELFRRSQVPRVDAQLIRQDKFPETLEKKEVENAGIALKISASLLVGCTGISTAMSTMGTLGRIPGGNSPWLRSLVALVSIDNMIVTMSYNFKYTLKTLTGLFTCCRRPSKTPASLFHSSQKPANRIDPVSAQVHDSGQVLSS